MRFARFEGVEHGIANDTPMAEFAESTALRIIQGVEAAQCLATAQAQHLLRRPAGESRRKAVDLPNPSFPVHHHHHHGRVAIDGAEQGLLIGQGLFPFLSFADVAYDGLQKVFLPEFQSIEVDFCVKQFAVQPTVLPLEQLGFTGKRRFNLLQSLLFGIPPVGLLRWRELVVGSLVKNILPLAGIHLKRFLVAIDETVVLHQEDGVAC